MKVSVDKHFGNPTVILVQGNQSFYIEKETMVEARWYAKMFRVALTNHDAEQAKKRKKGDCQ